MGVNVVIYIFTNINHKPYMCLTIKNRHSTVICPNFWLGVCLYLYQQRNPVPLGQHPVFLEEYNRSVVSAADRKRTFFKSNRNLVGPPQATWKASYWHGSFPPGYSPQLVFWQWWTRSSFRATLISKRVNEPKACQQNVTKTPPLPPPPF